MPDVTYDGQPETLYTKLWNQHVVHEYASGECLIYIDRHLLHEVTSPQAFEGLGTKSRAFRRRDLSLAMVDHDVPTRPRTYPVELMEYVHDSEALQQIQTLEENVQEHGLLYFGLDSDYQGIVHVVGPELGFTLPGTTVVCGDSHTSTHGAFGALAFGIGTSEVEHVMATTTLVLPKSRSMKIDVNGELDSFSTSKDLILHIIGLIGVNGGTGYVIEFCGDAIRQLTMEARMSLCNMAIEAGARSGLVAPDDTTFSYLEGRSLAPKDERWQEALGFWQTLRSDEGAVFDKVIEIDASEVCPLVTYGTNPGEVVKINECVPTDANPTSLAYMDLKPGQAMEGLKIDKVFIGSCTNSRLEDLRLCARLLRGIGDSRKAENVKEVIVVPGSSTIKKEAEEEGLHLIFEKAGFQWREPGCSMCLGMNDDRLDAYERCASTSNRNFEGRQGALSRTHLCSPSMAVAAALKGCLYDVRKLKFSIPVNEFRMRTKIQRDFHLPAPQASSTRQGECETYTPEKLNKLVAVPCYIDRKDIDTDLIIPKQFLKCIKKSGLGKALFFPLRYEHKGDTVETAGPEIPDFPLNKRKDATILLSLENFGCGSSREHAVWALKDFGIRVVIAPSFAEIFRSNCLKNGVAPVALQEDEVQLLKSDAEQGNQISIDIENLQITRVVNGDIFDFHIPKLARDNLLNGFDEIDLTLQHESKIRGFEERRPAWFKAACIPDALQ